MWNANTQAAVLITPRFPRRNPSGLRVSLLSDIAQEKRIQGAEAKKLYSNYSVITQKQGGPDKSQKTLVRSQLPFWLHSARGNYIGGGEMEIQRSGCFHNSAKTRPF